MDFNIGQIAAGAISRLLGGGQPNMVETNRQLQQSRQITQMGIDLYNNTDLAATDAQAIAELQANAQQDAMSALNNYDAMSSARGSSIFKGSTVKDQARTDIAYNSGRDARTLASNLLTTRANRKAALLPNPSSPIQGMQGAMAMDQYANDRAAAQQNAIFNIAYGLMNPDKKPGTSGAKQMDYSPAPIQGGYNPALDAARRAMGQDYRIGAF